MSGPRLVHLSPALRIATRRDFIFEIWTGTGGIADMRTLHRLHADFIQQRGGKVATVSVLKFLKLTGIPDEVREEVKKRLQTIRDHTSAGLTVIEQGGFTASMVRSLIGGLILFQRPPYPNQVFDKIDEGAAWLAPLLEPVDGRPARAADVRAVYDFLVAAG